MNDHMLPNYLCESLAWQVLGQLVRRHPRNLWIKTRAVNGVEHASIVDRKSGRSVGLRGVNAMALGVPRGPHNWQGFFQSDDPRDWLADYERSIGLPTVAGHLPASTPASLALRWMAAFLRSEIGSRQRMIAGGQHRWASVPSPWHGLVPWEASWPGRHLGIEPLFVGPIDGRPMYAVTTAGELWRRDGPVVALPHLHKSRAPIAALLAATLDSTGSSGASEEFGVRDVATLLLDSVGVLHARGYQLLRIYPGLSGSGAFWRTAVTVSSNFMPAPWDGFPIRDSDSAFNWTSGNEFEIGDLTVTAATTPEEVANELLGQLRGAGFGCDPSYVYWYEGLLKAVHNLGHLPIAYKDWPDDDPSWELDQHLRYAAPPASP